MKTMIIGYSGSGKSTLAGKIAKHQNCPVVYIDTIFWLPGWVSRPREDCNRILKEFLDSNDSWVIDGTYSKNNYDRRLEEADRIIFMNFNRFNCLYRALKRRIKYSGISRDSMTVGCPEKFDFEFFLWIMFKGRNKVNKGHFKKALDNYGDKVIVIKNQRQLDAFEKAEGILG